MLKSFCLSLLLLTTFTVFANSGRIKIEGKVKNPTASILKITTIHNKEIKAVELSSDGVFKAGFRAEGGFYKLKYGRISVNIFLNPKDDLDIMFDAQNFDSSLNFSGQGQKRNNYLAEKRIIETEMTKNLKRFYSADESQFLNNTKALKDKCIELLEVYDTETFFQRAEKKNLEYKRLLSIKNYKNSYRFYIGEEIEPSESFYQPLKKVDINNKKEYLSQPHYYYLVNSIWSDKIGEAEGVDAMMNVFKKVQFEELAIGLLNGFYSDISPDEPKAQDYLKLIKKLTTYQPFIEACEKNMKKS